MSLFNFKTHTITNKGLLLLYDLYWLRFQKPGNTWYELTDYLRDKLAEDGIKISYDDKNEDLLFGFYKPHISMKKILKGIL